MSVPELEALDPGQVTQTAYAQAPRSRVSARRKLPWLAVAAWGSAASILLLFGWLMWDVLVHGVPQLSWAFLTEAPQDAGRAGGIGPIIVSTLLIVGVCMATSLPIGLGAALALAEYTEADRGLGRLLRRLLDVLAAVPSIVFGLFGNALFAIYLGLGFSILSGGLTLACMVLPIFIRTAESAFSAVPIEIRQAAAAVALSRWRTQFTLLLPLALPGLMAGFVLGLGRAIAETAALVFTSGYVDRMPGSLFDSGRALSIHIYDLSMNISGGEDMAYASAAVLILLQLILNAGTLQLARVWQRRSLRLE